MTLQSSGPISLANIQTEFGGSNPISLNEYYAGGLYVPAGTSGVNGAIPSSGQISFANFYGTSSVIVIAQPPVDNNITGRRQASYIIFGSSQTYSQINLTAPVFLGNAVTPTSQSSDYAIMMVQNYGDPLNYNTGSTSNVLNTWFSLDGSGAQWGYSATNGFAFTGNFTFSIRKKGTSTIISSTTFDIQALNTVS